MNRDLATTHLKSIAELAEQDDPALASILLAVCCALRAGDDITNSLCVTLMTWQREYVIPAIDAELSALSQGIEENWPP